MNTQRDKKRTKLKFWGFFLIFFVLLAGIGIPLWYKSHDSSQIEVKIYLTDGYNSSIRLQSQSTINLTSGITFDRLNIKVNNKNQYQEIDGFGAALTDSSAWLLYNLNSTDYLNVMEKLFDPMNGIGINYLRLPIGSSDCALTWYTYDDTLNDVNLENFSIEHDQAYIIPVLKEALRLNPSLKIMGTPFSAPGWMKLGNNLTEPETKGLIGGNLNPEMYDVYANYLVKFILAYQTENISLDTITIQNEPFHSPSDYPGMLMNESEQANFVKILGPKFLSNNISTKILILDHNWDQYNEVLTTLSDENAREYISGVAWHGYSSPDPEKQSLIHDAYPDQGQYFTEVTGFNAAPNFHDNLVWLYQNIFIGSTRNWGKTVLLWNLALNENGGPILRPYYDMRGVITISNTDHSVEQEVEYYAIGHMSKFVQSGAVRIDSNTFPTKIESVAFQNPDNSIVLVACNPDNIEHSFHVTWDGKMFSYSLSPKSVATFLWN